MVTKPTIGQQGWGEVLNTALDELDETASSALPFVKNDEGGLLPAPVRAPSLAVERWFPNRRTAHTILWAQDQTGYAVGWDRTIRKTTDGGDTFFNRAQALAYSAGYRGCFLVLASGDLLTIEKSGTTPTIRRSTDDGSTWSAATFTFPGTTAVLSPQSWCQDAVTGRVYVVEYETTDTDTEVRVWRSTDNGATFTVFHTFPGPGTASGTAGRVRHGHSAQYDSVSQRVYFTMGDDQPAAGIYRVNAAGTGVEKVVTNADLTSLGAQSARAVALMFFPTHIAWGIDVSTNPYIVRMARDQIGQATPVAAKGTYRLNGAGWGTVRAAADGSMWLASADAEAPALDAGGHLYAITDNGANAWEVGSFPAKAGQEFSGLVPVGQAELHGGSGIVWFANWISGVSRPFQARAMVTRGGGVSLSPPEERTRGGQPSAVSSGLVTLAAGATVNFGETLAPQANAKLYVYDVGRFNESGAGTVAVEVVRMDTNTAIYTLFQGSATAQYRNNGRQADEYALVFTAPTNALPIRFRLRETGGTAGGVVSGYVTFAWGP